MIDEKKYKVRIDELLVKRGLVESREKAQRIILAGKVKIEIYNMKGQKIKTYNLEHTSPGYYQVSWDSCDDKGRSVASGIYLYRLSTGNYTSAKKMVLAK